MDNKSPDTDTPVADDSGQTSIDNVYKPPDSDAPDSPAAPKVSMAGYVFWAVMFVLNCCPALVILLVILGTLGASSVLKDIGDLIRFFLLLPLGIHKWPP